MRLDLQRKFQRPSMGARQDFFHRLRVGATFAIFLLVIKGAALWVVG